MGMRAACLLVGLALLVPAAVQAQNAAGDGDPATPRTPWGDPDLQGNYAMANMLSGARDVEAAAAAKRAGSE